MVKVILATRYLLKRRISYFAVLAVALCVFVVFVVITVLSGLTAEFKKNVHLSVGDCVVTTKSLVGFGYYEDFMGILEQTDFIEAISPVIKSCALVQGKGGFTPVGSSNDQTAEIMGNNHYRDSGAFLQTLY